MHVNNFDWLKGNRKLRVIRKSMTSLKWSNKSLMLFHLPLLSSFLSSFQRLFFIWKPARSCDRKSACNFWTAERSDGNCAGSHIVAMEALLPLPEVVGRDLQFYVQSQRQEQQQHFNALGSREIFAPGNLAAAGQNENRRERRVVENAL